MDKHLAEVIGRHGARVVYDAIDRYFGGKTADLEAMGLKPANLGDVYRWQRETFKALSPAEQSNDFQATLQAAKNYDRTSAKRQQALRARGRRLNAVLTDDRAIINLAVLIEEYGSERAAVEAALRRALPPT